MPDRLAELVRQRALVQEQLAWLNRQIDEAASQTVASRTDANDASRAPSSPAIALPLTNPAPPATMGKRTSAPLPADEILAKYQVPPAAVKENVRKGCFLYFAAALVLLALGIVGFYFAFGSR